MRPSSKRKPHAVLKVNVPSFKFEKAKEYSELYQEAFEQSEKLFDEKMASNKSSKLQKPKEEVKMPSLLKNESNRIKSGKLKPLDDKLAHSRLHEKQKHIEQNAHSNMEWINDLSKKEQQRVERPARSPERLNKLMKKGHKVELQPVKLGETPRELDELLQTGGKVKEGASKNLKDYDCWDNDKEPEEWVKMYVGTPPPHGKAPIYSKGEYVWTDIQLLNYDQKSGKFYVKVLENGLLKFVSRLSIQFKDEDPQKFQERLNLTKQRQKAADQAIKLLRYIETVDEKIVAPMPEKLVETLKGNHKQHMLFNSLMDQIKTIHTNYEKKFLLLDKKNTMGIPEPMPEVEEFKHLEAKTYQRFDEYTPNCEQLQNTHISKRPKQLRCQKQILQKGTQIINKYNLLGSLAESNSVFLLDNFKERLDKQSLNSKENWEIIWRSHIISEIQHILKEEYRFFVTQKDAYEKDYLKRVIIKFDVLFNTVVREKIIGESIEKYIKYIRSYIPPKAGQFYHLRSTPLLILQLNINVTATKKKKRKSKNMKETFVEQDGVEETIFYEPNLESVEEILLSPFETLENISQTFNKIERDLIPLLNLDSAPSYPITRQDPVLAEPIHVVSDLIKVAAKQPLKILEYFKAFSHLIEKSTGSILKKLFPEKTSITYLDKEEIEAKLTEIYNAKKTIERISIDQVNCGLFQVRTRGAKEILIARAIEVMNEILKKILEICSDGIKSIKKAYEERQKKLTPEEPSQLNEDQLKELHKLVSENDTTMQKLKNEVDTIANYFLTLEKYLYKIDDNTFISFWSLKEWPQTIKQAVGEAQRIIQERQAKLSEKLQNQKEIFNKKLIQLEKELEQIKKFGEYSDISKYFNRADKFREKIQECKKQIESFNHRQEMFKQAISTYEVLDAVESGFLPYFKIWNTAMKFDFEKQKTFNGPLLKNNFTQLEKLVNKEFLKETMELGKEFDSLNNDLASNIISEMKEDIEKFREKLWLIELLTTDALIKKPHYWKEISEACKLSKENKLEPNDQLTLKVILDLKLDEFREEIEQISKKAEKQWGLEKKLNGIIEQLKKLQIQTKPYPKANTYILEGVDESQQILDDNLNALLMMKSSPYIKPIINRLNMAEARIVLIQDTLENWIKTQRGWMYLEPIFSSEDIQQKMANEKLKFDQVDKHWKLTLQIFTREKNMWDNIESEKYKTEFQNSNKLLDEIQKSLSQYLQTKRRCFPRFFFLSDEELLEILAQTKDPETVQRHINKCFEGIGQLKMSKGIVSGMISMQKQEVDFSKRVDVNEGDKKGNVEKWLLQIEGVMIDTLKKITKTALEDESKRVQWVKKWPAQTVLGVNMIRWTNKAEESINNGAVKQYVHELVTQLKDIVGLVRTDLSQLDRLTLGALVTIDVHNKDVIQSLVDGNCSNIQEFSWIAQLRYYWVTEKWPKLPMPVRMINAELQYAFEYLGNSTRLVITPLTDRCYRTLMGAYHLYYGGAPEGPAGTGKTETVKDLAKAMAVPCVVFNCSDGLNFIAMRKFFKGLASSGSWCCFDEFNRIDLQVLSVIAQQVLTIQTAIRENKKIFNFDGEDITLILTCAINITMNPGYAGRSELPDNLKALFRPCAMMVPDYAMISEIYLYSVGFEEARDLARKIVASLRLSSEQLSSQDHYDFGMRAVKAILTAAGNLKRVMVNDAEDVVCLRALMDVNIPKFTVNDVPLFSSITSDLFPTTKLPKIDYGKLYESLVNYCVSKNYQPQEGFLSKCIQLFDTVNVRHGLMIVGAAFSGKSKITQVLEKGMGLLHGQEGFVKVQQLKLNPKSITSDQLYGKLDPNTKSWTDGVVAILMRKCAEQAEVKQRKWVVFDGPVDAVWIENMNTVLDDNKKLCLTSGQIIKLTSWMTIMFEVQDLAVASPATVSRCGMVFLETKQLGWFALIKTFIANLPEKLHKYGELIQTKSKYLINGTLAWTRKLGKFLVHQSEMTFVNTYLRIFGTYIKAYYEEESKVPKEIEEILTNLTVFCCIWSLGVALEESCRKKFSEFYMHLYNGTPDLLSNLKLDPDYEIAPIVFGVKIPEKVHVFDMYYNSQKFVWQNWSQTAPPFQIPKKISYNDLLIPTNDTIRFNYFLHLNIQNHMHVLFCGPTGTGKSINVSNELIQNYYNANSTFLATAFSGQTNANQVQRLIDSKVCTRRRKGQYWPEEGRNQIVIFIDDLNMPQKEKYGAQPPIELLRQWMDNGGWYDLQTKEFKYLCGINFVAAMLPPIGGRNVVTMRYIRHYNLIYVEPFDTESLVKIFNNVLEWYFTNLPQALPKSITNLKDNIISSTIELYNKVQSSKELLPTPAKSHYIYNLRDLSKVFQGITKASNKSFANQSDFIKLWAHECSRIFKDRLISIEDQVFFDNLLKDLIRTNFKRDWSSLVTVEPLLWASFIPTLYPDGDTTKKPLSDVYCELTNRDAVKKKCESYLEEYNNLYSANKMNLVLFMVAIEHVIKIVRVITTTFGHALLVGVGGSGRKSLAMLSSYIAYMTEYSEVNSKNWVQQVQKIMKIAGLQQKQTIFLFSDTQILKESMVEEVCNILNNGQIPNLFPTEEKAKIVEEISTIKPVGSFNEKYQYFVSLCKNNLHMVICMSPVGEDFRRRLRTFPTLVNCTTIDWFLPWPEEALISTANNHFKESMKIADEELRKGLVKISVDMQMRVTKLRNRYEQQLRRYYYVTPTSYLQLLSTMKKLLSNRKSMVDGQIKRYETGINKITETEAQVEVMQKQLEELKPKLEIATIENKELLVNLQKNQKDADAKKLICQGEERQCNIQRDEANALRADCQQDLDRVLPLLDQAAAALDKITTDDMTQLKSYVNPPVAAAIVMEGVCYVFNEDQKVPFQPKEPGSMQKIQDFWAYSKKNLLNAKLIQRVKEFREDKIKAIPERNIQKLKAFAQKPEFEKEKVFTASKAAGSLSLWIRAVVDTYGALLVVEPKKKQLAEAQEKLSSAEKILAEKKAALEEVLSLLRKLQEQYQTAKKKEEELKKNVERCIIQLDRAQKLIKGLGGEKIAWGKKVVEWNYEKETVLGDCVLCSGIIAYMGAFPITYREDTLNEWKQLVGQLNIKSNEKFSLQNVLSDPLTIGIWTNSQQLPNDNFSIDNAIILKNSSRWPLMIDPQIQANTWIKNMENGIKVIRPTQSAKQLEMLLENAIQVGVPLLLENIGETIDSLFEPLLQKKLIKAGASYRLKFGDKQLDYSTDFRFYMTTKLGKPHYSPEVCVKVTLLNFQVTLEGLDDQMLNIVVKMQEPVKEEQKQRNIKEFFDNKNKQRATEDKILHLLGNATGNLLDDENLIETLQNSKKESEEISEKMEKLEYFQSQFKVIRNFYKDVSKRVSNLYFITLDLANVQPTYQWSLEFYINLYQRSIQKSIPGKENRCKNIIDKFQINFYESLCRSLLEKDKLIFSFLICTKILLSEKKIKNNDLRFLMVGGTWIESPFPLPAQLNWMSNKVWCSICQLAKTLPGFESLVEDFQTFHKDFTRIYNAVDPYSEKWPGKYAESTRFNRLIILRIIRPDKFTQSVQKLISEEIGKEYIEPPPFDLEQAYRDSDCNTPLIFILSPGADPRIQITNLAEKTGFKASFSILSLGQGQGELAEKAIKVAMAQGKWVLLQNCHLAPSFMPDLERILQNAENINKDFRIWLTSMPSNIFPVTILMKGIKMTYQPPRGLKNNLLRTFGTLSAASFEECQKPREWKKMFLGLSFFHALILERRKYGPLGWNIPYEFTAADFAISQLQLKMFLNQYEHIPYEALNYMAAEANYGGRVTDPMDRRLIKIILKRFYSQEIIKDGFKMTKDAVYRILDNPTHQSALEYIKSLPLNDSTEVFGLHPNAQISSAIIETTTLCETILMLLPRDVAGGGVSAESMIKAKISQIVKKLPKPFDTDEAAKLHPVKYEESMNTVLQQQLMRFNKLLKTVHSSLINVDKAIDGFVVMSQELQIVFNSLYDNRVPDVWHKVSYPSLKPLGSWINDFVERLKFMQKWIEEGAPPNYWISGFFFTQSFLTGVLQNYARKYKYPIDTLAFDFLVLPKNSKQHDISKNPKDGCYVHGLFLDGARWDEDLKCLNQSHNKILYSPVPYMWFIPTNAKKEASENDSYIAPVYKTSIRRGVLSTTGHSTNYVLSVQLPIEKSTNSAHWVKRGVAMLTQLDD